ncbi:MAG: hypothetical protein HYW92_03865 [Nitrosarchaeum sp.]|nr:hypothetical protein [Nitrosarchaeum sp.]
MVKIPIDEKKALSQWKTLRETSVKLPSGYSVYLSEKEHISTGKKGISVSNKRFFFPIDLGDVKELVEANL